MNAIDEKAGELFDFAYTQPEGFTREEAMEHLGLTQASTFRKILRRLRLTLGGDEINLVCEPRGSSQTWLYQLVGDVNRAGPWVRNRLRDLESRLETMHAVSSSLVNSTDGRTVDGRKARMIEKTLRRLQEDLADFRDEQLILARP